MILCSVVYVGLIFWGLMKRKGKLPDWASGAVWRNIFLIVLISNTLAVGLFFLDGQGEKEPDKVWRNTYGEGSRQEKYKVTVGDEVEREDIVVEVGEQTYTHQEIQKMFQQILGEMEGVILGENKSLDRVEKNMNLLTQWKEYPVQIQWELDNYEVMNIQGEIETEKTKPEGTLVELKGTLSYEGEEALYVTNAMIYPESKTKKEKWIDDIQVLAKQQEEKDRTKENFQLPKAIHGKTIQWEKKVERRGYVVLILGGICAVLMVALQKQKEQKAEKARQEQMLTDYPEIVNKFVLLLSTGMPIKSVWERIIKNYEEQKRSTGERAAYEEMGYTFREMQSGITESEAYERFGQRCRIPSYVKFGALLAQNMKKGSRGLSDLLSNESIQAFENRKSRAKRLGEEAGTKLLLPMFGMLAVVLIIVIVPAFLSMQI